MLYYDRIDVSEGVNVNKTSKPKEWDTCQYWYFLNKECNFQPNACKRCQDLLMMSVNLNETYILNIKGADCCCFVNRINKSKAINLMQNIHLTEKSRTL